MEHILSVHVQHHRESRNGHLDDDESVAKKLTRRSLHALGILIDCLEPFRGSQGQNKTVKILTYAMPSHILVSVFATPLVQDSMDAYLA